MAHTNAWSDTIPAGSVQAKEIDNHIRQVRLDVRERMNDLVVDFTTDPIVMQGKYGGAVTGKERYFGPFDFRGEEIMEDDNTTGGLSITDGTSSTSHLYATIPLQPGNTITACSFLINTHGEGVITGNLFYNVYSTTPTRATVATVTSNNTAGVQIINPSAFSHVIVTGRIYYLHVQLAGSNTFGIGSRLYGARVVYSCDNATQHN